MATYQEKELSTHQLKAGKEIVEYMGEGIPNVRWNILFAQPQSGKTDTFYFVGAEMMRKGKIRQIVIICGNSDTDLKNQTESSRDYFLNYKYDRYLENNIGMNRNERESLREQIFDNIKIIWGEELTKEPVVKRDTLVIWEESHAAQGKGMRPDIFFKNMDITCDGDPEKLERNNNYVLSVSATPFSELSDVIHEEGNQFKHKVNLEVDDAYYGIEKMFESRNIKTFKDWKSKLNEVMELETSSPKYAVIRVSNDVLSETAKTIAVSNEWVTIDCNSNKGSEKNLNMMKFQPTKNTLIIIKGMCRMGKVVNKHYVSFVMETAKDSNSDVVFQGLLARMFGWHQFRNIKVYINEKILKRNDFDTYMNLIKGENVIPVRAANIVRPKHVSKNVNNFIIPIRISKDDRTIDGSEEISFMNKNIKDTIIRSCHDSLIDDRHTNFNSQAVLDEVAENLKKFDTKNIRVYQIKKSIKSYSEFARKINSSIVSRTPGLLGSSGGCDDNEIKIFVYNYSDRENNITKEDVFIIARTSRNDCDINKMVPKTTKKEVFCGTSTSDPATNVDAETNVDGSNGVYSINIAVETSTHVVKMKNALSELIQLSIARSSSLNKPRKMVSNYKKDSSGHFKWKGIIMKKNVEKTLQPGGKIYVGMHEKYGVHLKIVKAKGRHIVFPSHYKGFVRYAEISW
jgi:hypothetical protein